MSPRPSATRTLEHVLLALLDEKTMHGCELYQKWCEIKVISLIWNLKQPMLYAILAKLIISRRCGKDNLMEMIRIQKSACQT